MYNDRCRDNTTMCTEMLAINGTLLYKYMINVTFVDQFKQEMYFDSNGDPPAWYDIHTKWCIIFECDDERCSYFTIDPQVRLHARTNRMWGINSRRYEEVMKVVEK